jgi:hypothetical protein
MDRFNKEAFLEWKAHPLTKVFCQFLRDNQTELARKWAAGVEMSPQHQAKALLLGEMSDLDWQDYAQFYGLEADNEDQPEAGR